ncbi:MAG: hypothetical protein ACK5KO_04735 [Arachnia sp.]
MIDRDRVLVETAKTRRQRLLSSLTFGRMQDRRIARNNLGRFIGSVILAAVISAVCVGYAFVIHTLDSQAISQAQTNYANALRNAQPLEEGDTTDTNGRPIDPETGWVSGPYGTWYDPLTGWQIDPENGYVIDASTQWEINPATGKAVGKAGLG